MELPTIAFLWQNDVDPADSVPPRRSRSAPRLSAKATPHCCTSASACFCTSEPGPCVPPLASFARSPRKPPPRPPPPPPPRARERARGCPRASSAPPACRATPTHRRRATPSGSARGRPPGRRGGRSRPRSGAGRRSAPSRTPRRPRSERSAGGSAPGSTACAASYRNLAGRCATSTRPFYAYGARGQPLNLRFLESPTSRRAFGKLWDPFFHF